MMRNIPFVAAWLALIWLTADTPSRADEPASEPWIEVAPGVLRSSGTPSAYALVDGSAALLIDAPRGANVAALERHGVKKLELVLLTHHHRDTSALAGQLSAAGISVRAAKSAEPWLSVDGVRRYWQTVMPRPVAGRQPSLQERTFGGGAFLVHGQGIDRIDCSLEDGQEIEWRSWKLEVIATPGHSRDHIALAARGKSGAKRAILFCGDALCEPGKMWSPYTTDWDHWTGQGLQAAAQSLRKLVELDPAIVCPAHGRPIEKNCAAALERTADAATEVARFKSFEWYSYQRLGDPPSYEFLAPSQVATAGDRAWSRISPHLFLTGNTYALASKTGAVMLVDPYGPQIAEQVRTLQAEEKLGAVERVMISHAHNDHYQGVFLLPDRHKFQIWTLREVADPITRPYFYCAPYVDARPVVVDRQLRDGETASWHEYEFRFHHLPGQTVFTMGVETVIDGKKCFFTADNFFHAQQFSGSGGWSGRNRSWPLPYAESAQKVLDASPDWVLAEHGGAFAFNRDDFRRRVRWGQEAATAADALSPSGKHRRDWDPQRVHFEPLLQPVQPGGKLSGTLVVTNPLDSSETLTVTLDGPHWLSPFEETITMAPGETVRREMVVEVSKDAPAGRQVVPVVVRHGDAEDGSDTFFVADVAPAMPVYPRVNVNHGFQVDPEWPSSRSAYPWGDMAGMAVDADGLVWTLNRGEMPIQVYTPEGKLVREWGKGIVTEGHQMSIGPRGHIWIPDLVQHVVFKFSPEGKLLQTIGTPGEAANDEAHFFEPSDVAETPEGDIFVSDGYGNNRVVHLDAEGKFVKSWGTLGVLPGEFSLPHSIAIDSRGRLYVADRNNGRIQIFDRSGKFLRQWCNLIVPWTVRITAKDEVYVCGSSPAQWRKSDVQMGLPPRDQLVMKLDTDGRLLRWWSFPSVEKGTPTQPGELSWVHGMAVDAKGNLYLGDIHGNRAQKFVLVRAAATGP